MFVALPIVFCALLLPVNVAASTSCKTTKQGKEYLGTLSVTKSGRTCQTWTSQTPQKHTFNSANLFLDASVSAANNYCRNPDGSADGPWCYTTDSTVRWEYCDVKFCAVPDECKKTKLGVEYRGTVSVTNTGRTCQAWKNQSPHQHSVNQDSMFPDQSITDANNYCRNPDGGPLGPWCYTTDSAVRWEYCSIPFCAPAQCKTTKQGKEYRGTLSKTKSGLTCQAWSSQSPHSHAANTDNLFPDQNVGEASNYCRAADSSSDGPWCYTTDPAKRWEYCDVPFCKPAQCKTTKQGKEYRGTLSKTKSGLTCQAWTSQSPHKHSANSDNLFPDQNVGQASNYCRAADSSPDGPWCYTTDPKTRWEYCDVPVCGEVVVRNGSQCRAV